MILTAAIFGSVLFGLGAAFVLAPVAAIIPARLQHQWALEVEAHALAQKNQISPASYSYTVLQKVLLSSIAAILGYAIIATHGVNAGGLAVAVYYFSLLLLVAINLKSGLLPDIVALPALWLGLLYYAYAGAGTEHIYGASAGYLAPFIIMLVFKAFTGKEFIGRGDLKAMAMAGAWFGLAGLPLFFSGFAAGFVAWFLALQFSSKRVQGLVCTGPAHFVGALAATFGTKAF